MKIFKLLFLITFIFYTNIIYSGNTVSPLTFIYSDTNEISVIGKYTEILEDSTNLLSVSDVLASKSFIKSNLEVPNLAVSNSSFWLKFNIKNISEKKSLLLDLSYPLMDLVELYTLNPDGTYKVTSMGDNKKFSERVYNHQHYLFDLIIPKNKSQSYLLKIKSTEQILVPLSIGS